MNITVLFIILLLSLTADFHYYIQDILTVLDVSFLKFEQVQL